MNILTNELPKESTAQVLDADRQPRPAQVKEDQAGQSEGDGQAARASDQQGLGRDQAGKLLEKAREYFKRQGVDLNFKLVDGSSTFQVEVVDAQSNKVIRKIPEDEIVELAGNLKRMAKGVMDKAV